MIRGLPHKVAHQIVNRTCVSPDDVHPLWRDLLRDAAQGLRMFGHGDVLFELRHQSSGAAANIGDKVRCHVRDEWAEVRGGYPPHKTGSPGLLETEVGWTRPPTYGLEWVAA